MARRNDHSKEELKELIFNSALEIVIKEGNDVLTARKLAKKIGYTPGTIYVYYKNFDELILQINFSTLEKMYSLINEKLKKISSAKNQIKAIAEIYLDFSIKEKNLWELLSNYEYKTINTLPKWYGDKVSEIFTLVETPISQFSKSKKEVQNLSRVLWSSLHGIAILSSRAKLTNAKSSSREEILKSFLCNFLAGLEN